MGNTFGDGYFSSFRTPPAPTFYPPNRTPVTQDVLEIGLIVAFVMTWFCILIATLGMVLVNWKKFIQTMAKATFFLYFVTCILVSIWGFGWRVGSIHTETTYKQFSNRSISADVGLKVGLYAFNVTLKGSPVNQSGDMVDYNEHYNFGILQGRLGFGSQAGLISREFRQAQLRGTPLPILWIAEYFTIDGELIRWGRNHRQAGYYTALLQWTAFCFFILTFLLLPGALSYGANGLILTGLTLIISCCVYAGLYNETGPPVVVPFETATLTTHFGWAFILTLINGLILFFLGNTIWLLYLRFPNTLHDLFGIEIIEEDDAAYQNQPLDGEEQPAVIENAAASGNVEQSTKFSRSTQASRRFGANRGSIRSPAIGNSTPMKPSLAKSLTIEEPDLESSMIFQSRTAYLPDRMSVRRIRRTMRKKPREGRPSPSSPVTDDSMELTNMATSPVALSPGAMASSSPRAQSPLAADSGVVISVKGGLAKNAFKQQSTTASFEVRTRFPTLDEGDEEATAANALKPTEEESDEDLGIAQEV